MFQGSHVVHNCFTRCGAIWDVRLWHKTKFEKFGLNAFCQKWAEYYCGLNGTVDCIINTLWKKILFTFIFWAHRDNKNTVVKSFFKKWCLDIIFFFMYVIQYIPEDSRIFISKLFDTLLVCKIYTCTPADYGLHFVPVLLGIWFQKNRFEWVSGVDMLKYLPI